MQLALDMPYWIETRFMAYCVLYIDDLVQDCSNYIVLAVELLQLCAKPSINSETKGDMLITNQNCYMTICLNKIM